MRLIPVLDIRHGRAVHAVAGDRAHYEPVRGRLHPDADPIGLATAFRRELGLDDLYLADLGAIVAGEPPAFELYRRLASIGLSLWVDAGIRTADDVPALLDAGVGRLVVGLETVAGPSALAGVVDRAGGDRVAFSLDLREGRPIVADGSTWGTDDPARLAGIAADLGVAAIIELDLARVGTGRGVEPRRPVEPGRAEWFIGGGIADADELPGLARRGYAGVLVGSAFHDGRIGRAEVEGLRPPGISGRRSS